MENLVNGLRERATAIGTKMIDLDNEKATLTEQLATPSPYADDLAVARSELRAVTNQINKGNNPTHVPQALSL